VKISATTIATRAIAATTTMKTGLRARTIRDPSPPQEPTMRDDRQRAKLTGPGAARARLTGMSLATRVFLTNAAVLTAAVVALAVSPVTVSDPVALREGVVLVGALTALLLVNLVLFRRAFTPLVRLTDLMREVDLLAPGRRIPVDRGDVEVAELTLAFNEMLDRLEEERRQSAKRSLGAQEAERRRVAQELHDEVGQSLTAIVLQLDRLARLPADDVRGELGEAREAARASLEEVRQIAQRLRPEALDELGLGSALAALAERVASYGDLSVARRLERSLPPLSSEAEVVVYRVAQEALTNVLRHARASHAVLAVQGDAEGVILRVTDDGSGLDGTRSGSGIRGMRERALLVGGALEVGTGPEGGAEVRLTVPVEAE
jgi:two-component system sensor histidine kinase UhpB